MHGGIQCLEILINSMHSINKKGGNELKAQTNKSIACKYLNLFIKNIITKLIILLAQNLIEYINYLYTHFYFIFKAI